MKKSYSKPSLGIKEYAQFENVYTNCNQNASPCGSNPGGGGGTNTTDTGNPNAPSWDYGFGNPS